METASLASQTPWKSLASFGCVGSDCVGDIDGDTIVGVSDILQLLSVFGANC